MEVESAKTGASDVWEALGKGFVDKETVWEAYGENLRIVMESADELIEAEEGKSVVTADHGNLLDERVSLLRIRLYGHPSYIHHPSLREVPWAVTGESDEVNERQVSANVENQLRSLGYT